MRAFGEDSGQRESHGSPKTCGLRYGDVKASIVSYLNRFRGRLLDVEFSSFTAAAAEGDEEDELEAEGDSFAASTCRWTSPSCSRNSGG